MKEPLVSIVILTYANQLKLTKTCLQSLKKISYSHSEIILVDNNSTDNTGEYVKKHFPHVRIIANKTNRGFCGGNNDGFNQAKGKYVMFLNNDTTVASDFISVLVARLEKDKKIGAIQPKMRQLIKTNKLDACASYLTPTGFLYHFGYSQNQSDKKYNVPLEMYTVKGACFMASKKLIGEIGLFDEDFFAYFEETDFCHRVWMHGYRVVYEPGTEMFHVGGGDKNNDHPESLQFISYRNRIQSYIKNLEIKYLIPLLVVHVILCLLVSLIFLFLGKPRAGLSILQALFWNIVNIKRILLKRKIIQKKIRVVSEDTYIKKIMRNPGFSYYHHFLINPRGKYNYTNSSTA